MTSGLEKSTAKARGNNGWAYMCRILDSRLRGNDKSIFHRCHPLFTGSLNSLLLPEPAAYAHSAHASTIFSKGAQQKTSEAVIDEHLYVLLSPKTNDISPLNDERTPGMTSGLEKSAAKASGNERPRRGRVRLFDPAGGFQNVSPAGEFRTRSE